MKLLTLGMSKFDFVPAVVILLRNGRAVLTTSLISGVKFTQSAATGREAPISRGRAPNLAWGDHPLSHFLWNAVDVTARVRGQQDIDDNRGWTRPGQISMHRILGLYRISVHAAMMGAMQLTASI
jgi:hypothetical protein